MSGFLEENDVELEAKNRIMLSIKDYLKILDKHISGHCSKLSDTPIALALGNDRRANGRPF